MLIGEVSRQSGVSTRMLRHYDSLGLVTPTGRTAGGYREYSTDDIRRLFHAESLRTLGLSLNETKRALDESDFVPTDLVGDLIRHTRQRIATEQELLTKLEHINAAAPPDWEDALRIVTMLRALESEFAARRQQAILDQNENAALPIEALVEAALAEDDLNVAGALHWSLARAGGQGLAELAVGLDSVDVTVRRRATAAIAAVSTTEATVHLGRAVQDSDAAVRARAALALGSRGSVDAIPALLDMVFEGPLDIEAAEVLGRLTTVSPSPDTPSPDTIATLMCNKLGTTDSTPIRLRITQALAEIPGSAAHEALDALSHDNNRTIAATARSIMHAQKQIHARRRNPQRGFGNDPPLDTPLLP